MQTCPLNPSVEFSSDPINHYLFRGNAGNARPGGVALLPLPHGPGKDALKISEVLPFEKSQMDDILLTIGWTTIPVN